MKLIRKAVLALALVMAMAVVPTVSMYSEPQIQAQAAFTTTATGYTKASDVKYVTSGNYIANWGARGENCTFLSKYAQSFYTGSYVYETLSQVSGGSTQSNASSSALYSSLQTLMRSKHTNETSYDATKNMYKYTDCVSNNYSNISSFYSGHVLNGAWDSAATWNREHAWPKSKSLNGSGNGGADEADIIMLRPTWVQENSSRGNLAYGESSGYYDPDTENGNVRGDCARIWLYVYVRWGNTQYAWGKSGVMESMNILLKWMEEDPVDTWEMGRNDAVQAITGTRNVFVDYPEYAWLLFGKSVPQNVSTPSRAGVSGGGSSSGGNSSSSSSSGNSSSSGSSSSSSGDVDTTCQHKYGDWLIIKAPTYEADGKKAQICDECGDRIEEVIPKLCHHVYGDWLIIKAPTYDTEGKRAHVCELCENREEEVIPPLGAVVDGEQTSDCSSSISGMVTAVLLSALGFVFLKKEENN